MGAIGRMRVRLPSRIAPGDLVRVRVLIIHPMERVERDAQDRIIERPYNYIDRMVVEYRGRTILTVDTTQGVSENPAFTFSVRATDPGPLTVTFTDTSGQTYAQTVHIRFS